MANEKTEQTVKTTVEPAVYVVHGDGCDAIKVTTSSGGGDDWVSIELDDRFLYMPPPQARAVAAAMLKVCDEIEGGAQ